jgi:hypothetical protein
MAEDSHCLECYTVSFGSNLLTDIIKISEDLNLWQHSCEILICCNGYLLLLKCMKFYRVLTVVSYIYDSLTSEICD